MVLESPMKTVPLAYGKTGLNISVPDNAHVIEPRHLHWNGSGIPAPAPDRAVRSQRESLLVADGEGLDGRLWLDLARQDEDQAEKRACEPAAARHSDLLAVVWDPQCQLRHDGPGLARPHSENWR